MQRQLADKTRKKIIKFATEGRFIELTEAEAANNHIILNKLVTTMLYEVQRHGWAAHHCSQLRWCVNQLDPGFKGKDQSYYENYLERQEALHLTHFGSYLSDDSDSEEERQFVTKTAAEKAELLREATADQTKAQMQNLTYKITQKKVPERKEGAKIKRNPKPPKPLAVKGELRLGVTPAKMFDMKERTKIPYGPGVNLTVVKRDLNHLNFLLKSGKYTIEAACAELTRAAALRGEVFTQFLIAQYRGVTHLTSRWNQPSRRAHRRDADELGKEQYSASVHVATGINLFRDYARAKELHAENPALLRDNAMLLRELLLTLREPRPYSYAGYTYANLAILLQNIYTQDYDGFHQLIAEHPELKSILLNPVNPFISMGDTPKHACGYAYGAKVYAGHEGDRLRPRWQSNGRAERPYSGVVYTSLHPLTDFTSDGPLHLITLNRNAEIKLKDELNIIAERETCFPAFLPAQRVCHKHITKYPSFKGEYKTIYAYKYGMNKHVYDKFKAKILGTPPHSPDHRAAKNLLGEWLCSFYEVKLIKKAEQMAEARQGVVIYRDCDGTFTMVPPIYSVNSHDSGITPAMKTPVKQKQQLRSSFSSPNKVIAPIQDEQAIKSILGITEEISEERPEDVLISAAGNARMSTQVSLMLNALSNDRTLALDRYLAIPSFRAAINEAFNSEGIDDARLIHIAVAKHDLTQLHRILSLPECDRGSHAYNLRTFLDNGQYSFGDLTPLMLSIVLGFDDIALALIADSHVDMDDTCNLLSSHYNQLTKSPDSENEDSSDTVEEPTFIHGNTALHLAVIFDRPAIVPALLAQDIDVDAVNTTGLTAIQLARMYQRNTILDICLEPLSVSLSGLRI